MVLTIMLGLFALFMVIGAPLGFAMGLSAVLALAWQGQVPLLQLPVRMFGALDSYALMAVPLFILAGNLMNVGGITERIIRLANLLVGRIRGGLAQVNIFTSVLFSAVNGSALADTAAVGTMMIPAMEKEGYDRRFSVVVTAVSALIGPILPPSIMAILYGAITGVSIGGLFLAAVVPGLILGAALMTLTWFLAPRYGWRRPERRPERSETATRIVLTSMPAVLMPAIIVGGIVLGVFTPTEAGAVAVLYGLAIAFWMRQMTPGHFYRFVVSSAMTTASALIILGGSGLFGWVLTREGFGFLLGETILSISDDKLVVFGLVLLGLFFIGWFLEGLAAMILIVPIVAPLLNSVGIDPLQSGVAMIMMLLVGAVTPPVGVVALFACKIGEVSYQSTFRILLPYVAIVFVVVALVALVPALTLWLPQSLI
ncbi:TRAP transporter large permease [Afifella pfennigii]|uniref:TRAP transporter large permease n=1 Tax=Afifella pfennigii TaxID=209897 RepID=UPI00047DE6E3|nr:TRAP transporter large permease [Afifella pfennigii]